MWRLSDLKLLKTAYFDTDEDHYGADQPGRAAPGPGRIDLRANPGSGVERITAVDGTSRKAQPASTCSPASMCGVPTIVGHYLIQSVPATNGLIVLDIADGREARRKESRLKLSDEYYPHSTGWDAKTQRLVVSSNYHPRTGFIS